MRVQPDLLMYWKYRSERTFCTLAKRLNLYGSGGLPKTRARCKVGIPPWSCGTD